MEEKKLTFLSNIPLLEGAFYVPAPFFSPKHAEILHEQIPEIVKPQIQCRLSGKGPIFAAYGEEHNDKYPDFFEPIFETCSNLLPNRPFQCSVNIYDSLECELHPHKDSVGKQVIIISLGSSISLDFYLIDSPRELYCSLFLEPNSLLFLSGKSFSSFLHGISSREKDFIDSKTANKDLLPSSLPDSIPRSQNRISLMMWN